ncbi:hypothetical protein AHiyo8_46450 [Arthrobacter sp. Hiyo8]|uniref:hypothetical protein n=1 Tax=Arthrobacter sp. Hiyo1 TaxID=1588020 RepID=UPI000683A797|nr:hypothetical protein [Arthrobacter sp. Hiyo1]BAS16342.1 hypothetical protein AHiyo8_46450 [Arthrobacter sp. Hiyo8]GAP60589.1 hypothetical protein AHiyo1_41490 [Arthrobacter sp. Hiyo1]
MRKSAKIFTALSVAGLAVAAGSAFTGTGVATAGQAASDQFVGGTVSQSVTGATLNSLVYGFTDGTNTAVNQVTLTFADATGGKTPTLSLTGGTAATFTCTAIDGTTHISVCDAATGTSQTGVTSAAVTVS